MTSQKVKINYSDMLAGLLDGAGIEYEREFKFHPTRRWRADFHIVGHSLLVEVEGITYRGQGTRHQTGVGMQADLLKYNEAALMGYSVLRFSPAMVTGRAVEQTKGKPLIEPAIATIQRYIGRDHAKPAKTGRNRARRK